MLSSLGSIFGSLIALALKGMSGQTLGSLPVSWKPAWRAEGAGTLSFYCWGSLRLLTEVHLERKGRLDKFLDRNRHLLGSEVLETQQEKYILLGIWMRPVWLQKKASWNRISRPFWYMGLNTQRNKTCSMGIYFPPWCQGFVRTIQRNLNKKKGQQRMQVPKNLTPSVHPLDSHSASHLNVFLWENLSLPSSP